MAAPNSNFDQALTTATWNYLNRDLVDNIFGKMNTIGVYKKMGMYKGVDGGERMVIPLEYAQNNTATALGAWDEVDIRETNEFTMAEYDWASYGVTVALSKLDLLQNQGKSRVINLMNAKLKNAENSLRDLMNGDLFTGNASDAKKILGLTQLVAATGTVGNINSSTQTWWVSTIDSTAEVLDPADIETAYNSASVNIAPPNLHITTQTLYEKYLDIARDTIQHNIPNAKVAELGFPGGVQYRGKPVIWDTDCQTGSWYMLNTDYIALYFATDYNFEVSPQMEMQKQHVFAWKTLWFGQHGISARRFHARLQAKTAV